MNLRLRTTIAAGLIGLAASTALSAPVHADPFDTVGMQASMVCAALRVDPTVGEIKRQVARLNTIYVPESEQRVMAYAMNTLCPQYQYLALQAVQDIMNGGQGV
jgi:hypothetical protein